MSKLTEVKMPPLDGTEFVVVYVFEKHLLSENVMVVNGTVMIETHVGWLQYSDNPPWDSDLDARYFVAAK